MSRWNPIGWLILGPILGGAGFALLVYATDIGLPAWLTAGSSQRSVPIGVMAVVAAILTVLWTLMEAQGPSPRFLWYPLAGFAGGLTMMIAVTNDGSAVLLGTGMASIIAAFIGCIGSVLHGPNETSAKERQGLIDYANSLDD